jgi:ABC-2 type transport system ATP-binding protein
LRVNVRHDRDHGCAISETLQLFTMPDTTGVITPVARSAASPALFVRALRKRYDDVIAVDGLDLDVLTGQCFGLLGPNGAGKTTTIEICEGLLAPDGGEVRVLGSDWSTDSRSLRERLGIQLQETQLSEKLTVEETLRLFRSFYRRGQSVPRVITLVQLDEKRGARVGTLSGGQKQRLALACALIGDPELLFLDEPTTGLDPQSRRQLWDLVETLKADGRTIVLTTHYMDEAERLCDRVAIVDHGRVIALGTPRELVASLGVNQIVFFSVDGGAASLDEAALAELGNAVKAQRAPRATDGGWELHVAAPHEAIPALLEALLQHDLKLTELRTHSPTLEDVFVTLTGRALRDA